MFRVDIHREENFEGLTFEMVLTGMGGVCMAMVAYFSCTSVQVFDTLLTTRGLMAVALVRNGKARTKPGNELPSRRCGTLCARDCCFQCRDQRFLIGPIVTY